MGNLLPCWRRDTQGPVSSNTSDVVLPPRPSAPAQVATPSVRYVALFNKTSDTSDQLPLNQGDVLELEDSNQPDEEWIKVRSTRLNRIGFVPLNHIAREGSDESYPWFHYHMTLQEATKALTNLNSLPGMFVIRRSESTPGSFALSIWDGTKVRHYRIQVEVQEGNSAGKMYFLNNSRPFNSLRELVHYYEKNSSGLCSVLTFTIPAVAPQLRRLAKDCWELPRSSFKLIHELGFGAFGVVYLATWNNNREVAVKTLRKGSTSKREFLQEADVMKDISHKNLVQFYGVCSDMEPMYIVLEYMKNGNLLHFLQSNKGNGIPQNTMIDMAVQICEGMAYLEFKKFVHRDLAARNVLLGSNMECKLSDFGLTRLVSGASSEVHTVGRIPVRWTAPEAAITHVFTHKSDMWSFGILMFEIFTYGQLPYHDLRLDEIIQKLDRGYRLPCPPNCPTEVYSLMSGAWQKQPTNRPTFEYAMSFLNDFSTNVEGKYT